MTAASTPPDSLAGLVRGLDHIAIVVPSIAEARKTYEGTLGMGGGEVEFVADQRVNVLCVDAGGQRIELVEPASEDSPVTKFLEKRGGETLLPHFAQAIQVGRRGRRGVRSAHGGQGGRRRAVGAAG